MVRVTARILENGLEKKLDFWGKNREEAERRLREYLEKHPLAVALDVT